MTPSEHRYLKTLSGLIGLRKGEILHGAAMGGHIVVAEKAAEMEVLVLEEDDRPLSEVEQATDAGLAEKPMIFGSIPKMDEFGRMSEEDIEAIAREGEGAAKNIG